MTPPWLTVLTATGRSDYYQDTMTNLCLQGADQFKGRRRVFVDGKFEDHNHYAFYVPRRVGKSPLSTQEKMIGTKEGTSPCNATGMQRQTQSISSISRDDILPCKKSLLHSWRRFLFPRI